MARRGSDLRTYRRTNAALVLALLVYLGLAFGREARMGRSEIFPFSGWSLFSLVPNEVRDYSARVLSVDGRALEVPTYFEDTAALFPTASENLARGAIQELGRALKTTCEDTAGRARHYFESVFLGGRGPVVYEIVDRRYDPLERWRTGVFRSEQVMAQFHYHSPDPAP